MFGLYVTESYNVYSFVSDSFHSTLCLWDHPFFHFCLLSLYLATSLNSLINSKAPPSSLSGSSWYFLICLPASCLPTRSPTSAHNISLLPPKFSGLQGKFSQSLCGHLVTSPGAEGHYVGDQGPVICFAGIVENARDWEGAVQALFLQLILWSLGKVHLGEEAVAGCSMDVPGPRWGFKGRRWL